jgi:hypothetical protein
MKEPEVTASYDGLCHGRVTLQIGNGSISQAVDPVTAWIVMALVEIQEKLDRVQLRENV